MPRKPGKHRKTGAIPDLSKYYEGDGSDYDPNDPGFVVWDDLNHLRDHPEDDPADPSRLTTVEHEEFLLILEELASRESEALVLFEAMPEQERFFSSNADERICRGGNRGGKTLAVSIEFARAVTGQDPHGKYPVKDGRAIMVGKDLLHVSKVMYRKLFLPGAFLLIKDPDTGKLRAFRPGCEWDEDHLDLTIPSPPLIPKRFLRKDSVSWENRREEIPKTIKLTTGWEITCFSSLGAPPQGWDLDLVWFDEEIDHPGWYPEVSARLLDRRKKNQKTGKVTGGKFCWSATPQAGTQHLFNLCQRAAEEKDDLELDENGKPKEMPTIEEFFFGMLDNIHVTQHSKDTFIKKLEGNEDEYRVRVLGDFALIGMRVFPEFLPKSIHGCRAFPIPHEWTRYVAIDPGRQVCGVLFAAIPPPNVRTMETPDGVIIDLRGRVILYKELYIKKCSASLFAKKMKEAVGEEIIEEWWIDHQAGRMHDMTSGKTVEEWYSSELRRVKVRSMRSGYGFHWGASDVDAGLEAVRTGLHVVDGKSKWLVFHDRCRWLCWEAERYSFKKNPGRNQGVGDKPLKLHDHLMDCWRYLASATLKYVKPRVGKRPGNYAYDYIQEKKRKKMQKSKWGNSIHLG